MVLDGILAHKRAEVAARKPAGWKSEEGIPASDRSLEDALRRPHTGFILECKKASPSKGLLRADFDPVAIAREYATVADGISVLTDEKFFQGRLDYVAKVRAAVDVPVLCKDFIVDPFQIYEARRYGADAILLMMNVLDDATFEKCFAAATSLSMDALVEVHNEEELARAIALNARIIGINNRSFADLSVDLATTEKLAAKVPSDAVLISESGIENHADVVRLRPLVNAFLVGSSLVRQADLRFAINALVYGPVKVCGLTRREDALAAHELGAVYGGLIFAAESKRRVSLSQAAEIARDVPLRFVGVFANHPVEEVANCAQTLSLFAVQLHGREDDNYIETLRSHLRPSVEIWKAVPVTDRVADISTRATRNLFDGKTGGGGLPFDWSLLKHTDLQAAVVAGGLNPENAARAERLGAFALDVNSGVEISPGVKDRKMIENFMRNLRGKGRTE